MFEGWHLKMILLICLLCLPFSCYCELEQGQSSVKVCEDSYLLTESNPNKLYSKVLQKTIASKVGKFPLEVDVTVPKSSSSHLAIESTGSVQRVQNQSFSQGFYPQSSFLCPWTYEGNFIPTRVPPILYNAKLITSGPFRIRGFNKVGHCNCAPITTPVSVLNFNSCLFGKERWIMDTITVTVGYTCLGPY